MPGLQWTWGSLMGPSAPCLEIAARDAAAVWVKMFLIEHWGYVLTWLPFDSRLRMEYVLCRPLYRPPALGSASELTLSTIYQ